MKPTVRARSLGLLWLLWASALGGCADATDEEPDPATPRHTSAALVTATASKILPAEPITRGSFGSAVDVDWPTAIVGAPDDHADGTYGAGSAHVLVATGPDGPLAQQATLRSPSGSETGGFGRAVAIQGDLALVSAPTGGSAGADAPGVVYAFRRDGVTWSVEDELRASEAANKDGLGAALALDGDRAAIVLLAGTLKAVRVFRRDAPGWTEEATLYDPMGLAGFGRAVALSGDRLLVGQSNNFELQARAHVFMRKSSGWEFAGTLQPTSASGWSADSVALDGDLAIVGGGAADAYWWSGSEWIATGLIAAPAEPTSAVALSRDLAFAGTTQAIDVFQNQSIAYQWIAWKKRQTLQAMVSGSVVAMGTATAASRDAADRGVLVAGAPLEDDSDGAAYLFQLTSPVVTVERVSSVGNLDDAGFGGDVALAGDSPVVVTLRTSWTETIGHESVFVFAPTGDTWQPETDLFVPRATPGMPHIDYIADVAASDGLIAVSLSVDGACRLQLYEPDSKAWSVAADLDGSCHHVAVAEKLVVDEGGSVFVRGAAGWQQTEWPSLPGGFGVATDGTTTVNGGYPESVIYSQGEYGWVGAGALVHDFEMPAGLALAVSGDTALVGLLPDATQTAPGVVHVHVRQGTSWIETQVLRPSIAADSDRFGAAVALQAGRALIGAPGSDRAFLFERRGTEWTEALALVVPDPGTARGFGSAVALHGDLAIVGAPGDDVLGRDSGSAYVFSLGGSGCIDESTFSGPDGDVACAPYVCDPAGCLTHCDSAADCTFGNRCALDGQCMSRLVVPAHRPSCAVAHPTTSRDRPIPSALLLAALIGAARRAARCSRSARVPAGEARRSRAHSRCSG